jgi:hypothetical protein
VSMQCGIKAYAPEKNQAIHRMILFSFHQSDLILDILHMLEPVVGTSNQSNIGSALSQYKCLTPQCV